ncbi:hypothetical protein SUGI_1027970 [Cryptomeria japonica]|nr:hypothetical protein SUGI_1027970 [Cryptomeria japonica]
MGYCLLHGFLSASAHHDPVDILSRLNLEYNESMEVDDYRIYIAQELGSVKDFLEKAASQVNYNGSSCKKSISVGLSSTPWVQALVLNDSFGDAIKQLDQITTILSSCPEVEISEAVLDFAQQAYKHVVKASVLLGNLQELISSNTLLNRSQQRYYREDKSQGCVVDGTKCQYSKCGKGKLLLNCATGFAAGVIGGAQGTFYTVNNSQDNPQHPIPGTLRYAVNLAASITKGVWIKFSEDLVICLKEMLWIKSHTTIDGRGFNVTITCKNIVLAGIHNVILHNFQISGITKTDTVHIFSGTTMVWVDHLTSFDAKLGLVSVVEGSTDVTISNCDLSNKNFNMLLGASDSDTVDQKLRVTVFRNWFRNSRQRMPHCRWGYCHVVNNLYNNWGYYAIGGRAHAKVYSEKNVFCAGHHQEVTPWFKGHSSSFDTTATIQSTGDLFLNGATFHQFLGFGSLTPPTYTHHRDYPPTHPTTSLVNLVQHCSGALFGPKLDECLRI